MGTLRRLAVFVIAVASITAIVRGLMGTATSGVIAQGGNTTAALSGQTAAAAAGAGASSASSASGQSQTTLGFTTDAYDVATPHDTPIPKDALRLRIIANSDSTADQTVKRDVRNAIVVEVAKLVSGATTEQQAQQRVTAALPKLREIALHVTRTNGFSYPVKAMVGAALFPTKLYGNLVYPAGKYKALVITLGKGQGANWWCVLFPPLCFIDIASGDAIPNTAGFPDLPPLETLSITDQTGKPEKVQVRLAILDYGEEAWKAVKTWF